MSKRAPNLPTESPSPAFSDGIDSNDDVDTDQPGLRPHPLHPQSHPKKKRNQSIHMQLSNIPEEGQGEKEMIRNRVESAEENGYIKLESEHGDDDGSDSGSRSSSGSDYNINQKTEQKCQYDNHRHGRLKQSEQCERDLRILSSSSSSQTDLHLLTNADLGISFPDSPFDYNESRQILQYQQRQNQHHSQNLTLYPSCTESISNSSTYDYGSIDNIDNDSSTLRSCEHSSSIDTSVETSDAPSSTTVKVKNSIDFSYPFSNDHNENNNPENNSYTKDINDAIGKPSSHNTDTFNNQNMAQHNYAPYSSRRKSRLDDLAQTTHDHHRQEQHFSQVISKNSTTSSPPKSSNSNNSIHSESTPIISTVPPRHHHNHHKKHYNKNTKKVESLHRIHTRQLTVSLLIEKLIGVEQSKSFRDVQFSLLFFFQVATMIFLACKYGPEAIWSEVHSNNDNTSAATSIASIVGSTPATLGQVDKQQLLFTCQHFIMLAASSGVISIVISTLALMFMTLIAEKLIQIALCLAMSLALAWGTIGAIALYSYSKFIPITGLALAGLITAYAFVVWDRIPFASANLKTALTAIRSRPAVVAVTFGLQILMLIWAILTMFTVVGIYNAFHGKLTVDTKLRVMCYILLGVSFFWSVQLLLHMVHVTVAGVVKNWWFHEVSSKLPQPSTPPSPALLPPLSPPHSDKQQQSKEQHNHDDAVVARSFRRAAFHSLGSVCYGSLVVPFVRTLRRIPKYTHPCSATRDKLPNRFHSCMDALGSKFNRFAFVYVGLYGYNFVEAGERASALLNGRGWKKIVTDNLINDLLLLVSLVIGGVSGCLTIWIESFGSSAPITSSHHPISTSFLIGYTVGFVLSSILFGIISSSVNAVIILFAGNPVEFEENHPELSHGMRAAWREVFPGKVDFVETSLSSSSLKNLRLA